MHAVILLACVAAAVASYIPVHTGHAHDQAHKTYHDDLTAKHDFQKGDYGHDASAYKDKTSGQVQGAQDLYHKDHYTALKHNIDKDRKVIKHKADNNYAGAYYNGYAQQSGGAYQQGGQQQYGDKGHDGKHVADSHGQAGYGYGQLYNAHNADNSNAYANNGYSAYGNYGSQDQHKAGNAAQGHAAKSYVDHDETIAREDEDYAFKDVKHEKDFHKDFHNAHAAAADKGHSNTHFAHAAGHDSKQNTAKGHENSAAQHGKGHDHVADSSHYAAGQTHQDRSHKQGDQHVNYNNANQQYGQAHNLHDKENNAYHTKTRKVHKEEHEINHKDGNTQDNFWHDQNQLGHYGQQGDHQNAAHSASRDYAYSLNNIYHAQPYQPYYHHAIY